MDPPFQCFLHAQICQAQRQSQAPLLITGEVSNDSLRILDKALWRRPGQPCFYVLRIAERSKGWELGNWKDLG